MLFKLMIQVLLVMLVSDLQASDHLTLTSKALWRKCESVHRELQQHVHVLQHRGKLEFDACHYVFIISLRQWLWCGNFKFCLFTICWRVGNNCLGFERHTSFHIWFCARCKKRLNNGLQLFPLYGYFSRRGWDETFVSGHIWN